MTESGYSDPLTARAPVEPGPLPPGLASFAFIGHSLKAKLSMVMPTQDQVGNPLAGKIASVAVAISHPGTPAVIKDFAGPFDPGQQVEFELVGDVWDVDYTVQAKVTV